MALAFLHFVLPTRPSVGGIFALKSFEIAWNRWLIAFAGEGRTDCVFEPG